jgi:hypothetical protein
MEGIQGAEWVFWISRDQVHGLTKETIIHGLALQPASINIFEEGCKSN